MLIPKQKEYNYLLKQNQNFSWSLTATHFGVCWREQYYCYSVLFPCPTTSFRTPKSSKYSVAPFIASEDHWTSLEKIFYSESFESDFLIKEIELLKLKWTPEHFDFHMSVFLETHKHCFVSSTAQQNSDQSSGLNLHRPFHIIIPCQEVWRKQTTIPAVELLKIFCFLLLL